MITKVVFLEILFIIVMAIWFLLGFVGTEPTAPAPGYRRFIGYGGSFLPWLAVAILGYFFFVGK